MPKLNFVSYPQAETLIGAIDAKFDELGGAYVNKGAKAFADIPAAVTQAIVGFVYNITDDFETDARFVEGAGKEYPAGTNVVAVDNGEVTYSAVTPIGTENPANEGWFELVGGEYQLTTDTTVDGSKTYYEQTVTHDYKYDILGSFVNLAEIEKRIDDTQAMTSDKFDEEKDYAIGDVVTYEDKLYEFTAAYTAFSAVTPAGSENPADEGWYEYDSTTDTYSKTADTTVQAGKTYYQVNGWDDNKVTQTTVATLIDNSDPDELTTQQMTHLLEILNT